jgi:hypothetical protein
LEDHHDETMQNDTRLGILDRDDSYLVDAQEKGRAAVNMNGDGKSVYPTANN